MILIPDEHGKNAFQNTIIVVVFCLQNYSHTPRGPSWAGLSTQLLSAPQAQLQAKVASAWATQGWRWGWCHPEPSRTRHCLSPVCDERVRTEQGDHAACMCAPGCQPWCPHMRVLQPCGHRHGDYRPGRRPCMCGEEQPFGGKGALWIKAGATLPRTCLSCAQPQRPLLTALRERGQN